MQVEGEGFFLESIARMRTMSVDQKPLWGQMTPQHMVEHIVGSWRISNGRSKVGTVLSEDEVAKRRLFLFSDDPYAKNIPNPVFSKGLPPLRKASLADAIDLLEDEMRAFFAYHKSHPDAVEIHPVFGPLDVHGWLVFQSKHMSHHMAQFDLLKG
jgi:hypothetical protein